MSARLLSARLGLLLAGVLLALAAAPQAAQAHGANDPSASSYLARVSHVPAGMSAQVVDGDLRLWLQVPRGRTVLVLDYQGAPYLRLSRGHIWANENSQMYYFNQAPPETPPAGLTRNTPARWLPVGNGLAYQWHDGRLQAFASEAITPGASYVGSWHIPMLVNGHRAAVTGTLWYRAAPSIVWFWPAAVLLLCVLAAWRLGDGHLDQAVARMVGGLTLFGIALTAVGRDLHGRPGVSVVGVIELVLILVPTLWTAWRVLRARAGAFTFFLISIVGLWDALTLISTLLHGYVLLSVPPFLGRLATIICLGGAIALVLPSARLFRRQLEDEERATAVDTSDSALA